MSVLPYSLFGELLNQLLRIFCVHDYVIHKDRLLVLLLQLLCLLFPVLPCCTGYELQVTNKCKNWEEKFLSCLRSQGKSMESLPIILLLAVFYSCPLSSSILGLVRAFIMKVCEILSTAFSAFLELT